MGVYQVNIWAAVIAGLTIIFGAVYMFRTYQGIMLGETNALTSVFRDIEGSEKVTLYIICALVIILGVYPKPILHLSEAAVQQLLEQVNQQLISVK
jgi:NADH-quinone oxidoreductase subunit M